MKQIRVVSEKQASFARFYEKLLAGYPFLTFVSVVPGDDDDSFNVVVGGPRYLGAETIRLGAAGVLNGRKKVSPQRKNHRFRVIAAAGTAGALARQEHDSAHRPLRALRKREDGEVQG